MYEWCYRLPHQFTVQFSAATYFELEVKWINEMHYIMQVSLDLFDELMYLWIVDAMHMHIFPAYMFCMLKEEQYQCIKGATG